MRDRILRYAKWAWLCLVLAAAIWYMARNSQAVATHVRRMQAGQIGLAIALLVVTKLLLTEITRRSLRPKDSRPSYRSCFYINGVTQVAKYLPGGIWHFVGKFAYYRGMELGTAPSGQAMILENIWLVTSAIFTGVILSAPALGQTAGILPEALRGLARSPATVIGLAGGLWLVGMIGVELFVARDGWKALWRSAWLLLVQAGCWLAAGLSFWILFPAASRPGALPLAVGAFCLAWAVGYLTIFAPGGIGAREAVLLSLLAGITSPEQAVAIASVHRILWTGAELLMGAIAVFGGALGIDWGVGPASVADGSVVSG